MSRRAVTGSHNAQGSSMGSFLNPTNGLRGAMVAKGQQPRNHMRDNQRELRMIQDKNRETREEASYPKPEPYKLSQFRNVEARVYKENDMPSRDDDSEQIKDFLPKGTSRLRQQELEMNGREARKQLEDKMEEAKYYANAKPTTPRKSAVPKSYETASLARPSRADFITRNKMAAVSSLPRFERDEGQADLHVEYGRVPEYLEERKTKWAEEKAEQERRRPDPSCPPGMMLMPEGERLDTLGTLVASREEALNQLRGMPMQIETQKQKKKQDYLEGKLREIENAIGIFSKTKVFITRN